MTLKLLIVDDEPIERQALQQILQKAFPDFQMMQAKNGREAVEYALKEEPDLVLMDILMPGMTGLEAIELIQQKGIECQFVMVTAFDTFDYAKSALQLGVKDYLLKPTTPKEMTQIIGAIAEKIIAEKQQKQQFEPFIEQAFVSQLLFDAMDSVEDVLPLPLKETTSFAVLMVTFAEQVKGEAVLKKAQQYGVYSGVLYEQRRPFIIPIKEDFRQETMRVAKAFIAALEEQHYSSVAISSQIPSLDELSRGYREAWLVSGVAQRVIYFEDYVQFVPMEADWQAAIDQLDWHKIRLLFQQMTQQKPLAEAREKAFQKLWQVHTQLHQLGLEMGPPTLSFSDESQAQLLKDIFQAIDQLARHEEWLKKRQESDKMQQAKTYIDQHFSEDISLETLAAYLHLNPIYVSKLFKDKLNINYIDYLSEIRIKHAKKRLLEQETSTKEIAYDVGYRDLNYFSKVFKKYTGYSPTEYRKRALAYDEI